MFNRLISYGVSRKDPSNCVHIMHLKRPYVLAKLQTVLRTFGEFSDEDFWIDDIRSNCIVKVINQFPEDMISNTL